MEQTVRQTVLFNMMEEVAEVNRANGWYDSDRRFGEDIALLHSEVSEALEEFRDNRNFPYVENEQGECVPVYNADYGDRKPLGMPSELADVLVRLLDTCARWGVDIAAEFDAKMAYNRTRGYRHGNKTL